jgi:hypothetical protein
MRYSHARIIAALPGDETLHGLCAGMLREIVALGLAER